MCPVPPAALQLEWSFQTFHIRERFMTFDTFQQFADVAAAGTVNEDCVISPALIQRLRFEEMVALKQQADFVLYSGRSV